MNKKFVAFCFSLCFFASPIASAFGGGKVIVDIRQEDNIDSLEKVSETVSSYIEDVKKYDEKYPAEQINEDFLDDVISDYPDSPEERNVLRERLIRYGIRAKRIYNTVINKAKAFMAENDIPLFVSKDDYADSSQETYKESADGKPIVVLDFKKAVGYSQTDSQKQIVVENDENGLNRYQRIQEFKKALLKGDYKKVLQYGLFDGKEISDSKGVGDWASGANLKTRILSIPKGISEKEIGMALQIYVPSGNILLADRYKQYAGIDLKFSGENFENLNYVMPVAYRFPIGKDDSIIGYYNTILIPLKVEVKDISKALSIQADIEAYICRETSCVKEKLSPSLMLEPSDKREDAKYAAFIRMSEFYTPKEKSEDISISRLILENQFDKNESQTIKVEIKTPKAPADIDIFLSGENLPELTRPLISIDYSKVTARFKLRQNVEPEKLYGKEFFVTVRLKDGVSVRQKVTMEKQSAFDNESRKLNVGIIWFAFLGGFLLNLMPCVFPILSLKLMAFSEFGGKNYAYVRRSFTWNILGIGTAFVCMILLLLFLRWLGCALGWGIQFQNIWFLIFMNFVITIFLAHVMSIIDINAPDFVGKIIHKHSKDSRLGSFLSGLFLVLLSTPCSAPYLGTAIGFALAGTPLDIIFVMSAVFLGLATPYILIAVFPQVSALVPRPGNWMQTVNKIMRVMLVLTIIWLLSLIAAQTDIEFLFRMILYLLGFLTILGFRKILFVAINKGGYSRKLTHQLKKIYNFAALGLIGILLIIAFIDGGYAYKEKRLETEAYSLPELIEQDEIIGRLILGRKVLVRVGADWCLSCRYNDFAVFNTSSFEEFAIRHSIDIVDIDWSSYNEDVLNFMSRYGRRGVPFYIIYSRRIPEGLVLPEILDERSFKELIEKLDY